MLNPLKPRASANNHWDSDDIPWLLMGLASIAVLLFLVSLMLDYSALDVWTGLIVFLALTLVSVVLSSWVARREDDPWLFKVLILGLLVKFAGSMARFFMIFVLYGGSGDAGRYHEAGVTFVNHLRDGVPIHPIPIMNGFPPETRRIGDFVGAIYSVTGPSVYVGFLVFTFICFWGQVLIVRGFKVAVPEGDHRRFTLLVLFFPSLLFWPSSLGKEALMIGCLGLISYGGALLLAPKPQIRGAAFFVAGSLVVLLMRPHVALMAIGALALAFMVGVLNFSRDTSTPHSTRGRAIRFVALVLVLGLALMASTRLSQTFDEYGDGAGALASLEDTSSRTTHGGSEFQPSAITGARSFPAGLVTVFFRPFPWEADSLNGLIASAEGLLLFALFALSWRRLLSLPRLAVKRPFLVFCIAYAVLFAVGFSFIGNFGILTRQRVQALVVLLVVLSLPKAPTPSLMVRRRKPRNKADMPDDDGGGGEDEPPLWAVGDRVHGGD